MAIRIVGVDIPQNKRGEIALTYIYGIGRSSAAKILDKAGVDRNIKVQDWTDDMAAKVREIIGAEFKVEGDLRSEIQLNIKRLMDIGCYRGIRHRNGLPVRGQSTKNNARTRKGRATAANALISPATPTVSSQTTGTFTRNAVHSGSDLYCVGESQSI